MRFIYQKLEILNVLTAPVPDLSLEFALFTPKNKCGALAAVILHAAGRAMADN